MSRGEAFGRLGACLVLLAVAGSPAHADPTWTRNDAGECVRSWNAAELGRGPIVIANGVLLPFRELAGGLTDGAWGIVLSPFALAAGAVEGLAWVSAGILDTLTGGAFAISPDGMAQPHASPLLQFPEGHRSYTAYTVERLPLEHTECDVE